MKTPSADCYIRRLILGLMASWLLVMAVGTGTQTAQAAPVQIPDMPVFAQQHYLSCEYSATRAAVARWGIQLSEADFINNIPTNDNPHLGFRGNIDGSWGGIYDYGIYAEPIARFLATKGLNTKLIWNGVDSIKEELSYGRPVVVWVVGGMGYSSTVEASAAGQNFLLMPLEHAVTLYGYDDQGVYVADPGFGTYDYYAWADFQRSWNYLGNMAMSVWPTNQPAVAGERPGIAPEFYRFWLRNNGLEMMGMPIAAAYQENGKVYQYFERVRLEYALDQPLTQPIARGLLGRELTSGRSSEAAFRPLNEIEIEALDDAARSRFYYNTGFYIDQNFAWFWQFKGGLDTFGYPISRPFTENGFFVQYFERARLELHYDTPDQPPLIRLGLLGNERKMQGDNVG